MRKDEEKKFQSPYEKALVLYEQTLNTDFELKPSDDEYKYVRIPEHMDALLVHHFKLGFEPASGHPANDGMHVVLRIRKDKYEEMYARDVAYLKSLVGEQAKQDLDQGLSTSTAVEGRPQSLGEILQSLPDTEE